MREDVNKARDVLAIDIGNSSTKSCIFRNGIATKVISIPNNHSKFLNAFKKKLKKNSKYEAVIISSVNSVIKSKILPIFTCKKIYLVGETIKYRHLLLRLNYKNKSKLGSDRFCFAYFSYKNFKRNILNISLGSAIFIDYINNDGVYDGGIIVPGIQLQLISLQNCDMLKNITIVKKPERILGNSTNECISIGIINQIIQLLLMYVEKIKPSHIVISGGSFPLLKYYLPPSLKYIYEPHAVLKGLYLIYNDFVFLSQQRL
jgi:type III pantothenate kinase